MLDDHQQSVFESHPSVDQVREKVGAHLGVLGQLPASEPTRARMPPVTTPNRVPLSTMTRLDGTGNSRSIVSSPTMAIAPPGPGSVSILSTDGSHGTPSQSSNATLDRMMRTAIPTTSHGQCFTGCRSVRGSEI